METQLIIDNKARTATNGAVAERRSPITGKIVTRLAAANVDDALAAADSAAAAFATWFKSVRGVCKLIRNLRSCLGQLCCFEPTGRLFHDYGVRERPQSFWVRSQMNIERLKLDVVTIAPLPWGCGNGGRAQEMGKC